MVGPDAVPTVRPAQRSEAGVLTELARRSKAFWGYPPEWLALWADELLIADAAFGAGPVLAAEIGGRLAGCAAIGLDEPAPDAELSHLWVDPGFMGRGVGTALFHAAWVACLGADRSRLLIASDPNATAFYLALGCREIGELPSTPAGRTLPLLEYTG